MPRSGQEDLDRLRRDVDRGLRAKLDPEELLPLLARLARASQPGSDTWLFAHRYLAELGVEREPWRAALFARRVLERCPDDDGAWAVLGLAQSLLGNYRYAARVYERALALAPGNPWYAHNLGHLYDVALNRPDDALPLLAQATEAQTGEADIAASYAHALARCGKLAMAKRVLKRAIRHGATSDQMALWRWLNAGAPSEDELAEPAGESAGPGAASASSTSSTPSASSTSSTSSTSTRRKAKRRRPRERRSLGD